MSFECSACKKTFPNNKLLLNHSRVHSLDYYECADCGSKFKRKDSVRRHIESFCRKKTKILASKLNKYCFKCHICCSYFSKKERILNHYREDHQIEIEVQSISFKSHEAFQEWKLKIECDSILQFSIRNTWNTQTTKNRLYICHRSGSKITETINRFPRFKGSKKLEAYCPAEMSLKISNKDGSCKVNYVSTHVGHSVGSCYDLCFINLNSTNQIEIAKKFDSDVPLKKKNGKSNYESFLTNCTGLWTVKDEYNITSNYGIKSDEELPFGNDSIDIDLLISEHKNDILFFKDQMEDDIKFDVLQRDDFVLVYMNAWQEKNLKRFGHKVIAFDSTHGSNKENFLLHTLLVYDVNSKGIPVAFLITNRNDEEVMNIFLQCLRDQIGVIIPNTIITDIQPRYFNSWAVVMGSNVNFQLYCSWHVKEDWRQNLNKITDFSKRKIIKTQLFDLLEELNPVHFENKLATFLSIEDIDIENFLMYFRQTYSANTHRWAYCFRKNSGVDVISELKPFHRNLKYNEADGKIYWLSNTLSCLKTYVESLYLDEKIAPVPKKSCHKLQILRKNHHIADKFLKENPNIVIQIENDVWLVNSFQNAEAVYGVSKILQPIECTLYDEIKCQLPCHLCGTCSHEYTCDCLDASIRGRMCEHIHSVGIFLKNNKITVPITTELISAPDLGLIPAIPKIEPITLLESISIPDISLTPTISDIEQENQIRRLRRKILNSVKYVLDMIMNHNRGGMKITKQKLHELNKHFVRPMRFAAEMMCNKKRVCAQRPTIRSRIGNQKVKLQPRFFEIKRKPKNKRALSRRN